MSLTFLWTLGKLPLSMDSTTNVTYFFESTGCTYPLPFITPRPVTYTADGYPIKSPSCDPHAGGKVPRSEVDEKEMINFGRFNDSTTVLARGPCSFLHNAQM